MRLALVVWALLLMIFFWRIAAREANEAQKLVFSSSDSIKCGIPALNKFFSRLDIVMPEHRLVGGIESRAHAWPWTGQLITSDRHQCGCALIHPDVVLTAAHCFAKSRNPARYKILLGGHKTYTGELFSVQNISIHSLYQVIASAYDIAVLKIDPPATLSERISTICLPTTPPPINKMCVVTGWGRLREKGDRAKALREIHVPIISSTTCNNFRHYAGRLHTASMLCAGYNNGRVDSCQGDSGGPLQCQNKDGAWELQGVVSWGIGCAKPAFPGVYSRVISMVPWIKMQTRLLSSVKANLP